MIGNLKHTNMEFLGIFGVWKSDKMSPKGELMSKRGQGFSFFL
jgi:hypothetical protein